MLAFVAWIEGRKKYVGSLAILIAASTFFLPRFGMFGLILRGFVWHVWFGETASIFWLGIGYSPTASQILAIATSMVMAAGFCAIGFLVEALFKKIFRAGKMHEWLISHHWVSKLPYLGIVIFGLFPGGVVIGIIIALAAKLPKLRATVTILGVNLIKLCIYGRVMIFLRSLI